MTENEAIELHIGENIHRIGVMEEFLSTNPEADDKECRKNIQVLTKINGALQEIQKYRAIGTVEDITKAVRFLSVDDDESIIDDIEEVTKYRLIGTVEECREAIEKRRAKKPKKILDGTNRFYRYYCPACGRYFGNDKIHSGTFLFKEIYCQEEKCGQAIDWSDSK